MDDTNIVAIMDANTQMVKQLELRGGELANQLALIGEMLIGSSGALELRIEALESRIETLENPVVTP